MIFLAKIFNDLILLDSFTRLSKSIALFFSEVRVL